MSEPPKMGVLGSKEEIQDDQAGTKKEKTPEKYSPYCVDSDSETYDTEALSIMDINDIIGVQTEPVGESTLESEIAALKEIIEDTPEKDEEKSAEEGEKTTTDEQRDEDPKLDLKGESSDKLVEEKTEMSVDELADEPDSLNSEKLVEESPKADEEVENKKDDEDSDSKSKNMSLLLIGEAYISEDSQETDPDEMHIGKEPKVVFSCKPLVDKQCSNVSAEDAKRKDDEATIEDVYSSTSSPTILSEDKVDRIETEITISISAASQLENEDKASDTVEEITKNVEEKLLETGEGKSKKVVKDRFAGGSEDDEKELLDEIDDPISECGEEQEEQKSESDVHKNPRNDQSNSEGKIGGKSLIDDGKIMEGMILADETEWKSLESQSDLSTVPPNEIVGEELKSAGFSSEMEVDELENEEIPSDEFLQTPVDIESSISVREKSPENVDEALSTPKNSPKIDTTEEVSQSLELSEKVEESLPSSSEKIRVSEESIPDKIVEESEDIVEKVESVVDEPMEVESIEKSEESLIMESQPSAEELELEIEKELEEKITEETIMEKKSEIEVGKSQQEKEGNTSELDEPSSRKDSSTLMEELDDVEVSSSPIADFTLDFDSGELDEKIEKSPETDIRELELDSPTPENIPEDSKTPETVVMEITEEIDEKSGKISILDEKEDTPKPPAIEEIMKKNVPEVSGVSNSEKQIREISDDSSSQMEDISGTVESDLKSILDLQEDDLGKPINEVLETPEEISLVEARAIPDAEKKLPSQSDEFLEEALEDPSAGQSSDSLEGSLDLDLIPLVEEEEKVPIELEETSETVEKDLGNISEFSEPEKLDQGEDSLSEVIEDLVAGSPEIHDTKVDEKKLEESEVPVEKDEDVEEEVKEKENMIQEELVRSSSNLEMSFETPLEEKMDISEEILENVGSGDENRPSNPEISELESAVKFLQEAEEEVEEPVVTNNTLSNNTSGLVNFDLTEKTNVKESVDDQNELPIDSDPIGIDPIAISEAEIISEAAKLEDEKKKLSEKTIKVVSEDIEMVQEEENPSGSSKTQDSLSKPVLKELLESSAFQKIEENPAKCILTKSAVIPKISILEERLKVPPKIEIPMVEPRICDTPTTPKTSLLIQRDARISNYPNSPKSRDEMKISETTRKDSEKHDSEMVGSPRIILKIAKSAIADCAEPRSPKSPKIHSATNSPNPEDSPGQKLGKIKLKLSKSGHPSIISNETEREIGQQWHTEGSSSLSPLGMKIKLSKTGDASIVQSEKFDLPEDKNRLESPIGMKIKLSKSGDASIVQDSKDMGKHKMDSPKRTDSPIGLKFKLSKTGDASIIQTEKLEDDLRIKEKSELSQEVPKRTESPLGIKIKRFKGGDASIVPLDHIEDQQEIPKRVDSPMGMKIKLSKKGGGASIIPIDTHSDLKDKLEVPEISRRAESPLGMKIKLSKTGDASIIHSEFADDHNREKLKAEVSQISPGNTESLGMKIKFLKTGDVTIIHPDRLEEDSQDFRRTDSPLGMKIKLSKTGDASIISSQSSEVDERELKIHRPADSSVIESMKIKLSKTGHPTIVASDSEAVDRSQLILEPIKKLEENLSKRKESLLSPVDSKKAKLEAKLTHMLPELSIQPVNLREAKSSSLDHGNSSSISRNQMNVINQEISITHVKCHAKQSSGLTISEKLNCIFNKSPIKSPSDCEIIDHRPELIIVNENSNSSQDVMIIDEVTPLRTPEVKVPRKRGRPRRIGILSPPVRPATPPIVVQEDPLEIHEFSPGNSGEPKENERPKRTCRSQKSYAPPKRGRGRGRGKRKMDRLDRADLIGGKKARLNQDLTSIDDTTSFIGLNDELNSEMPNSSSELYKALRQPLKSSRTGIAAQSNLKEPLEQIASLLDSTAGSSLDNNEKIKAGLKSESGKDDKFGTPDLNWLTPLSKRQDVSTVQVIDEETRMSSSESFSRSQTPARNISVQGTEAIINDESQGSVLSTATTESEKVKVRNRRMEINFDPDEGPFTVDKIAEYEWPMDKKGDTFMIQEQISQYLGVKSFKRKYPDLKRRMVDMEERNFLRENGLVSESMCDMGLTAVGSSEVLDIMCSDFPDQYEEYRKHMREKQIREHSKKQKELTAAANAEKNRIDLAEMAVQSALSWNVGFNKARKESRKCSLDLQTFTIHVPKKQQKIEENGRINHYPVALIPGQYTDYYREYSPAELRYYPLNTVIYGPMRPNEPKFDSQSEGSQSDSDSDSSSDDSSCSSSEGTQDTEESQSTMDEVDIELSTQKDKSLKCKMCLKHLNKSNKSEILIQCGTCNGYVHPSCIDLTLDMVPHIQAYAWQCTDCKTCAQCHDPADEDKMLFCDMCDRGYHIYCVGLRRVPQGRWHCQECAICGSCGSREAGGVNAERNSVAQWQHEYKKGDKNTRVYVSTLCVPCSKLWRKGRYCPHCSRCHTVPRLDVEENLVHCSACDKYLHLDCVDIKDMIKVDRKRYQCDLCAPNNRQQVVKTLMSKVVRG